MESDGFFCFSLALIFALCTISIADSFNNLHLSLLEAKTSAMAVEQAGLKRFELETNADKAIAVAMEKSIIEGNENPQTVKKEINSALWKLFKGTTIKSQEKISFFFSTSLIPMLSELKSAQKTVLEEKNLSENSKLLLLNIKKHIVVSEYSITGGILKNNKIISEIENEKNRTIFLLPIGYSVKSLVVK